jgi:hypothetical protein
MELVLGTQELIGFGGAETYLTTVAEQLQALGHSVHVHAADQGEMAEQARRRGVRVVSADHELPPQCDAVLAQDAVAAYELADRYPGASQVFVMHSERSTADAPPQIDGVAAVVVVLSDRTERRARALARGPEAVRLRQPVDTDHLIPAGALNAAARRLLIADDGIRGPRRELLVAACADLGLECVGPEETANDEPRPDLSGVDIVVGSRRPIVEAMACGRAAYVLDADGCDGWVTAARYPALEADGFAGQAGSATFAAERLRRELAEYRPEMGLVNRDLAAAHHSGRVHAERLVALMGRPSAQPDGEDARLREMARLIRTTWTLESANTAMRRQLEDLGAELAQARHNLDNAMEIVRAHSEFVRTRRYRAALAIGRPADWLRRARRGRSDA